MVINLHTDSCRLRKRRNDEHGSQLQRRVSHFLSEVGQIVLVSTSDFLDQAMHSETLEHSGDLESGFVRHDDSKGAVLESPDIELSTNHSLKQLQVFALEKIKPAIGSLAVRRGLRDLFKVLDPHGRIFYRGDEFQVTSVRCFHQFPKNGETVNGFLQRGILHFPGAISMFHLPVVFEKTHIVDGRLDTQNDPQFVIHLNRHWPHVMLNPSPFDSSMEIIPDLSLISPMKLPSQEGRYLLGFDGVDRGTGHRFIEGMEISLVFENHIGGKFCLHQRPMVTRWEMSDHRAERFRHLIQSPMEEFHLELIGELLSLREILHLDKGILQKTIRETLPLEKAGQIMVPVKIELQPEGSPCWHPQIAQPQICKNEVEIVVDTLGFRASEKRPARLLVMPGFERRTGLQGGEDMDQSRMIATLGDDLLQTFFLTEILLSDKFDLQTIVPSQTLRLETDFFPQRLSKLGIIENANALRSQVATHRFGITDIGKRAGDDYPIEAREDASNLTGISFYQCGHGSNLLKDSQKGSLWL